MLSSLGQRLCFGAGQIGRRLKRAADLDAVSAVRVVRRARFYAQDERGVRAQEDALGRIERACAGEERHLHERAQAFGQEEIDCAVEIGALNRQDDVALCAVERVVVAREARVAQVARRDAPVDLIRANGRRRVEIRRLRDSGD